MLFRRKPVTAAALLILMMNIFRGHSLTCHRAEYQIGNECCPMCPAGQRVKTDCTEYRSTSCLPCTDGTFMNSLTGRKTCFPCSRCDKGSGLKIKTACTTTSDIVCEPLEGFYCRDYSEGGCIAAHKHTSCGPGQYISQKGTASRDTVCSDCSSGTFSDGTLTSCQPHTECGSMNQQLIKPGTVSADAECGEPGTTGVLIGVIVPLLFLLFGASASASAFCNFEMMFRRKDVTAAALLILMMNISRGHSLTCHRADSEYLIGNECCPMCPAGQRVKTDCTEYRTTSCLPCTDGRFMNSPTHRRLCFPCSRCDKGSGLKEKTACTTTSDIVCEPLEGFYCRDYSEGGCIAAQKHTSCIPGQYISQKGTASRDTVCSDCSSGTFSNGTLTSCQPHTECGSMNLQLIKPGTVSADAECGKPGTTGVLISVVIVGVFFLLIGASASAFLLYRLKMRGKGNAETIQTTPNHKALQTGPNQSKMHSKPNRRRHINRA